MRGWSAFLGAVLFLLTSGLFAQTLHPEKTITLPADVAVRFTAVSPTGSFVAGKCRDGKVRLWGLSSGEFVRTLELKAEQITAPLRFSDDGRLLAAGGAGGTVRIWEIPSGNLEREFTVPAAVEAIAISPDRHLVAVAPLEAAVQVWDLTTGKRLADLQPAFSGSSALAFSPDGRWLVTADADTEIRIYDARNGALRSMIADFLLETFAVTFSADGKYILAGGADKTISMIDVLSGKVVRAFPKQSGVVQYLLISRDGNSLAAAYSDPDDPRNPAPILIWDVATQAIRRTVLQPDVTPNGGEFLADGRLLLTSSSENQLRTWSVR